MTYRVLRTALAGLVIALALGACQQGPGGGGSTTQQQATEKSNNITRTFTVRSSQFQIADIVSGSVGVGFAAAEYNFPEITSAVVGRGLVHAYIQSTEPGDEAWTTLPFSMTVGISTTITLDITYGYTQGKVGLSIYSNVPARLLRTGLSAVDGWKLRVVVDPS